MLSATERDALLQWLSEEQKSFLQTEMSRGRRTIFANSLAKQKGAVIPEGASFEEIEFLLDEWIYIGYIDAGHVSNELKCECGRSLRYQHIVQFKPTGEIHKFGVDHLELHTGIDAKVVHEILQGFDIIDLEMDEILTKVKDSWTIEDLRLPPFTHLSLPQDIKRHIDLDIPLMDRQVQKLRSIIRQDLVVQTNRVPVSVPTRSIVLEPVQIDLFSEPKEEKNKGIKKHSPGLELDEWLKIPVVEMVESGVQSAAMICELLIKDHGASEESFSSGKRKIYVSVCFFLDSLVLLGRCKLISKDSQDRKYQLI
jgi:hypothetical protein